MQIKMLLFVIPFLILGFLCESATAKTSLGFREFQLGMKKDEALKKLPHCLTMEESVEKNIDRILKREKYDYSSCSYNDEFIYSYFDIKDTNVSVNFQFVDDRLVLIAFNFKPKQYEILKDALMQKFGKPTKRESDTLKTAIGASFQNETLTWHFSNGTAVISKYTDDIDHGQALISSITKKKIDEFERKKQATPGF